MSHFIADWYCFSLYLSTLRKYNFIRTLTPLVEKAVIVIEYIQKKRHDLIILQYIAVVSYSGHSVFVKDSDPSNWVNVLISRISFGLDCVIYKKCGKMSKTFQGKVDRSQSLEHSEAEDWLV